MGVQGITSKTAIIEEVAYGVFPGTPGMKRVEVSDDSIGPDYGYSDPETITGNLVKTANIRTRKTVGGSINVIGGPENGFGNFLKFSAGKVTTLNGYHWREHFTLIAAQTEITVANPTVVSASERVWYYTKLTNIWRLLVDTTDYTLVDGTGVVTLVVAAATDDELIVSYAEDVAGVYSHIIQSSTDIPSFQYWNTEGGIELFEYTGAKVNTATFTVNSEDFLQASVDLICQDEKYGTITGHTFPPALVLSNLDPFLFKQAQVIINHVANVDYESIEVGIDNALDPVYTIRCDDTVKDLTPTIQTVSLSGEIEFNDMVEYNQVDQGTFFFLQIDYGKCQGVEIGTTGKNYALEFFAPRVRNEVPDLPTNRDRMIFSVEGFANYDSQFDMAYEWVLINSESSI